MILRMSTKFSCRTILTYLGITLVFSVSVSVCCTVFKCMELGANDAIVMLIVNIFPPFVSAIHCLRSFVCCAENPVVIKYLLANVWSFVRAVCHYILYFGEFFGYFLIYIIKCYADFFLYLLFVVCICLMCVPSINTAVGDRYPASAISFSIHANI